MFPVLG